MANIRHAMTVDVEDYFQVSAFESSIPREKWSSFPLRVEHNTYRILSLFEQHQIKATFFVLGWVAKKCPRLILDIHAKGHEVACHSYLHQRVDTLDPKSFRDDTLKAKLILEDLIQAPVLGYRAPTYSMNPKTPWAHHVLEELGFQYSSSVYPIQHDLYGWPQAPRFCYTATPGGLLEIPISTFRASRNWPCGGGGYFRLFPYAFSRYMLKQLELKEKKPGVFYFHPWEIDVHQPRQQSLALKTRFRHYLNLKKMHGRIERLIEDFSWGSVHDVFIKGTELYSKPNTKRLSTHQAA